MEKKKVIVAVSASLFLLGAALLAYGLYYNSEMAVSMQPSLAPHANTTNTSINASINRTESILNIANRSSYLIFYPDLSKPYSYLAKAKSIAKQDPGLASTLLSIAYNDTQAQINKLNSYRLPSLYIMIVLTAISAYALYRTMTYKDKGQASQAGNKAGKAKGHNGK